MTSLFDMLPSMTSIPADISIHLERIITQIEPNITNPQYNTQTLFITIYLVTMLITNPFQMQRTLSRALYRMTIKIDNRSSNRLPTNPSIMRYHSLLILVKSIPIFLSHNFMDTIFQMLAFSTIEHSFIFFGLRMFIMVSNITTLHTIQFFKINITIITSYII